MINAVIHYSDGKVSIHSSEAKKVGTEFSPGFYSAVTDNENLSIYEESLEELHNPYRTPENNAIMAVVEGFFADGVYEKITSLGFIHKLGILLHGGQGTGKTSIMNFIAQKLIDEKGAIAFFCSNHNQLQSAIVLAASIREIQKNPIVFIGDEFEQYAQEGESMMKNFLDGNKSIPNTLFLAATNYITKVPDTLKKRSSRFKLVIEIPGITDKKLMRRVLKGISSKITPALFTKEEINDIVKDMKATTMDDLKHICLNKATNYYVPKEYATNVKSGIGFKSHDDNEGDGYDDEEGEDYRGDQKTVYSINLREIFGGSKLPQSTESNI